MSLTPRLLLPALSLLLGCAPSVAGPRRAAETAPACARAEWSPQLTSARSALLKNDATAVRGFLVWAGARTDLPDLSARTKGLATDPRLQPGQGEVGDLLDLGAEALGDVGMACGSCHTRSGKGPTFAPATAPPHAEGMAVHMARHMWSMDRLWDGIIGPSDARWIEGVSGLHDHPIDAERLHGREGGESPSDYMDWWIHQPGPTDGLKATGPERAAFYTHMLTACAACHAGTEGAPAAPTGPATP